MMDALERSVPVPKVEIAMHRAAWRQVLGKSPPLAAGGEDIHHAIYDFTHDDRSLAAAALCWRDHRFDLRPFFIGQVAWIAKLAAII
jgi:hypothetical protein